MYFTFNKQEKGINKQMKTRELNRKTKSTWNRKRKEMYYYNLIKNFMIASATATFMSAQRETVWIKITVFIVVIVIMMTLLHNADKEYVC